MSRTIWLRGEGGALMEHELPLHETISDKLRQGHISRVNADGTPFALTEGEDPSPTSDGLRPKDNAVKADWVAWAVTCGAAVEEATAMTKSHLIETHGGTVPEQVGSSKLVLTDPDPVLPPGTMAGPGDRVQLEDVPPPTQVEGDVDTTLNPKK